MINNNLDNLNLCKMDPGIICKKIRFEHGDSLEQIADKLQVSMSTISTFEHGGSCSFNLLKRYLANYGYSIMAERNVDDD